jgi:hypothetical protein
MVGLGVWERGADLRRGDEVLSWIGGTYVL